MLECGNEMINGYVVDEYGMIIDLLKVVNFDFVGCGGVSRLVRVKILGMG